MSNKRFELKNNDGIPTWLEDFYNEHLPDSGIFVEIGVGHTISRHWTIHNTAHVIKKNKEIFERCGSNTLDLLNYGFSGIYIEPIREFCYELKLLVENKDVKILNFGCSDKEEVLPLYGGETFRQNSHLTWPGGVDYIGRQVKCNTLSSILDGEKFSGSIDLMSIDVEGWEMKVLRGMREEHLPKLMIIEINKTPGIWDELAKKEYRLCYQDDRDAAFIRKI